MIARCESIVLICILYACHSSTLAFSPSPIPPSSIFAEGCSYYQRNAINLCQRGDLFPVKALCLILRNGKFVNSFIQSPVTAVILPVPGKIVYNYLRHLFLILSQSSRTSHFFLAIFKKKFRKCFWYLKFLYNLSGLIDVKIF